MMHRNAFALAGRKLFGTLTRGDSDALPRANRFWAFSPRVSGNKKCHYAPSYSARGGGRDKIMPIPPENVIANTAIT